MWPKKCPLLRKKTCLLPTLIKQSKECGEFRGLLIGDQLQGKDYFLRTCEATVLNLGTMPVPESVDFNRVSEKINQFFKIEQKLS